MAFTGFYESYALEMFQRPRMELTAREKMFYSEYVEDMAKPEFRPVIIDGNVTDYDVSNVGTVRNFVDMSQPQMNTDAEGYLYCTLKIANKDRRAYSHQMVAEAFVPNYGKHPHVRHINGNRGVNWYRNLEWFTGDGLVKGPIIAYTEDQIHNACKMMEESKVDLNKVICDTGVALRAINHIRYDGGWYHISRLYNLKVPKTLVNLKDASLSMKLTAWILDGKTNKDIIGTLSSTGMRSVVESKGLMDRLEYIREMVHKPE